MGKGQFLINGKFLSQRMTGVQRYAYELLLAADRLIEPGEIAVAVPPDAECVPDFKNISLIRCGKLTGTLWEQLSFPLLSSSMGAVTVSLCNASPLVCPGVVCLHDVKIRSFPQCYNLSFRIWYRILFRRATGKAERLITVSEHSKTELCRYYSIEPDLVSVIPDAWQHFDRIKADEGTLRRYSLEEGNYFFSLASLDPSKNFRWILKAAERNPDSIFAAAGGVNARVFSQKSGCCLPPNVRLLGYVSDGEAKELMRRCRAFIFPSFEEGFGIPPMEALSVGAPCVVSKTSCMPEIYGDSVIYIDPTDYSVDLDEVLKQPVSQPDQILARYSWDRSAEKLLTLLRSLKQTAIKAEAKAEKYK